MAKLNAKISLYNYVVVYKKDTKEILACIPLINRQDGFVKDDIEFKLYSNGIEPVFKEQDGIVKLE